MNKKKKQVIPKLKKPFIVNWGTYRSDTVVVVGYNFDQMIYAFKKIGISEDNIKEVVEDREKIEPSIQKASGFVWTSGGKSMLWLEKYDKESMDSQCTLVHEIVHLIYDILIKYRGVHAGDEAVAYQFEYLYKQIKLKLDDK